jgi:RHS repeat-associated protein
VDPDVTRTATAFTVNRCRQLSWGRRFREKRRKSFLRRRRNVILPGQYYDVESGLNYNMARDYDSATGRYVESDPIGLAGGSYSTYAYVGNDPLSWVDPWGLANLNFFNTATDPELWNLANGWNPSDSYSVAGHGLENPAYPSYNEISLPNGQGLSPEKLAQLILKDKKWKHRPIVIRGCALGEGVNSFAQQLANLLNVDVSAPTKVAFWESMNLPFGLGTWDLGLAFPLGGQVWTFHPKN